MTPDDRFAELLAAYDEALARGAAGPPADADLPAEFLARLREAQDCLCRLERQWPRTGPPTLPDGPPGAADAPARVGRFVVRHELGRGSFGIVYLAHDPQLSRDVALKIPRPDRLTTPEFRRRFAREGRTAAALEHPNVVAVHESGEVDGVSYIASAYCAGPTLAEWLRGRDEPVPPPDAARLVALVADALHHAHARGILHRDLKPSNILLQRQRPPANGRPDPAAADDPAPAGPASACCLLQSTYCIPKISDFGLAKLMDTPAGETNSGELLGTPRYMAPEQAAGNWKEVGPAADVWSLGVILYELLNGRPPFLGEGTLDTLRQVVDTEPIPLRRLRPRLAADLEAVCHKCLEKKPGQRYASAAALAADLRRFLDSRPTLARPLGAPRRAWRWAQRRPALAAMVGVSTAAVVALVAVAVAYAAQLRVHNAELTEAREREQQLKEEAQARGRLLQRKGYVDGIRRSAEALDNLQHQIAEPRSGRTIPDVLGALPRAEDCLLTGEPGRPAEELRGFEWYYLRRAGNGMRVWNGHRHEVTKVTFSQDGRLALSAGGTDETARLWDAALGKEVLRLRGRGVVTTASLSPDARFLAVGGYSEASDDGKRQAEDLHVWDRLSGERVADLTAGATVVDQVAFSPDGSRLLACVRSATGPSQVVARDTISWDECYRIPGSPAGVVVCFSPDDKAFTVVPRQAALGPTDVAVHSVQTGARTAAVPVGMAEPVARATYSPDGRLLALGGELGTVRVWDVSRGELRREWKFPGKRVTGLAFAPAGKTLAVSVTALPGAGPYVGVVRLWDVASGTPVSPEWSPGCNIANLAFAPDGRAVALCCWDGVIRLWDPERLTEFHPLPASHKETWAVAFAPDGRTLATAGDDLRVRLWDTSPLRLRVTRSGHAALVSCLAFHPGGRLLVSGSYDKRLRLWDVASGQVLGPPLAAHPAPVRCLAFAPDGRTLATGGRDHRIRLWDVREGAAMPVSFRAELPGHGTEDVISLAFSPDGKLLASGGDDKTVRLWDAGTGAEVRTIEVGWSVYGVAFAPDGQLAWAERGGDVRIAPPDNPEQARVLAGHRGAVRALAFSPDGRTLASGGDDREVRLWQVATGQPLLALRGHEKPVYALAFAPDGSALVSGCYDGTVRLWPAEPDRR